MQIIINSLVPIFLVIGLGTVLRKQNFLNAGNTQAFNRLAYFWGLPLFLFEKLGNASSGNGLANWFVATLILATIVAMGCSWLVARVRNIPFASRGALIQASLRGNLAFMGIPLVLFVLADIPTSTLSPADRVDVETAMLLSLAPVVIFYNFFSVLILAIYKQGAKAKLSWSEVAISVVTNPLLIACFAGVLVQKMGWVIPTSINRTCVLVGAGAFPLALIGIGSQLATINMASRWLEPMISSLIKCVICPLAAWLIATAFDLSDTERLVVVVLAAMPTAISSYVLADQMKSDSELAASAVVFATAFSVLPLSILLASI